VDADVSGHVARRVACRARLWHGDIRVNLAHPNELKHCHDEMSYLPGLHARETGADA